MNLSTLVTGVRNRSVGAYPDGVTKKKTSYECINRLYTDGRSIFLSTSFQLSAYCFRPVLHAI